MEALQGMDVVWRVIVAMAIFLAPGMMIWAIVLGAYLLIRRVAHNLRAGTWRHLEPIRR